VLHPRRHRSKQLTRCLDLFLADRHALDVDAEGIPLSFAKAHTAAKIYSARSTGDARRFGRRVEAVFILPRPTVKYEWPELTRDLLQNVERDARSVPPK
jgi:hypothetical protein